MNVVWRLGEATAEQVRAALPGDPHDSTVRTLLRVMETKGYLRHLARGKAYVYRAAVGRQKAAAGGSKRTHSILRGLGRGSRFTVD